MIISIHNFELHPGGVVEKWCAACIGETWANGRLVLVPGIKAAAHPPGPELDCAGSSSSSSSMVSMSMVSRLSTLLLLSLALACLPPGQGYPYPAKRVTCHTSADHLESRGW